MTNQLPAHLQKYQTRDVGATLSANLGSAMPPHVSIANGRFTLIDASNNELPGAWFDQKIGVYIDACIIDVNEHLSRIYFTGAYDSNAEGVRPDCFSDNGIGPSISAQSPQAPSCMPDPTGVNGCKWAVWGSKINQNGKKVPACSQKQKVALLVPGYNVLFLLAIPPNSHGPLREYTELCKGNGINMADLLTRVYFKAGEVGTLQFQAVSYIDEPTAELRQKAWDEKRTDALVGRNDTPRPALAATVQQSQPLVQQAPVQQIALNPQQQAIQTHGASLAHTQPAQQVIPPMQQAPVVMQQPAQQVQQPGPMMQAATLSAGAAAMNQPSLTVGAPSVVNQGQAAEGAPPARRKRRTAAEMAAANGAAAQATPANGQAGQPQPAQTAPQAPFPHPGQATQQFPQSTQAGALPGQTDMGFGIAQPAQPTSEVKAMLDDFFSQQG